jgi:hypothetical protein
MNETDRARLHAAYGKVVAKSWSEPTFKSRLMADPSTALAELNVSVPSGVTVKVMEDTDQVLHLVIPPRPGELSDEDLKRVTGGFTLVEQTIK